MDVGNRTPEEVGEAITERLSKYIANFVTVIVTDMAATSIAQGARYRSCR